MIAKAIKVALVGNPNVGKSTVFNALTGMNQHTGNWTGKTVETAKGELMHENTLIEIYDLPGTYSLNARSREEEVTRNFICENNYDAVIVICDAVCLERNMNLLLQVLDITSNVVVCVNLIDEAKKKNIFIDYKLLSEKLEIPILPICARNKEGFNDLLQTLIQVSYRDVIKNNNIICAESILTSEEYIKKAEMICSEVVVYTDKKYDKVERKIDRILTNKITGIPIMLGLLILIFWITISLANYPSEILFNFFNYMGEKLYFVFEYCNVPDFLQGILLDGGYKVLTWVVAVMLPPMAIFFPLFTILEDLGVLPRIAFNLDNVFRKCNACGKQALTMCMGFGCNACGVTGSRIIDSPRERLLAIITNSFVPCNGRFPTIIAIITMFVVGAGNGFESVFFGVVIFSFIILLGILMTFINSKFLSKTFLKGEASSFFLELPPYRIPKWREVITRSIFDRTCKVLWRATIVAFPAGIVIWFLANANVGEVSLLIRLTQILEPIGKFIGLDGAILMGFILGFPANEIVLPIILMIYNMTGVLLDTNDLIQIKEILIANGWTISTAISTILFSLMHWPCSTTCLTIYKETKSFKWTMLAILLPTVCGILACGLVNVLGNFF